MTVRVLARVPRTAFVLQSPCSLPFQGIGSLSTLPDVPGSATPESSTPYLKRASIASVLLRCGFSQFGLHEFIQKNRFLLNSSASDVEKCIQVLLSLGLSQRSLLSVVNSCSTALQLQSLMKWQGVFMELGSSKPSPSLVQSVFEQSEKFRIEPDNLLQGVKDMKNLGLSYETISKVLEELPLLSIARNCAYFDCRISLLKAVGLKSHDINRICYHFPEFLELSLECRLKPLFQELQDLGFGSVEVSKVLLDNSRMLLMMEVGELSRLMDLLNSLRCRVPIREKILRNGYLLACINAKLRVECLCRHGLIHRDAFKVLFVEPRTIIYDLGDIEKKIDFLLHKLGFCIEYLVEYPEYLGVNLEKQLIPRYNVIEHLRSQGGLGFDVGMKHLVKLSRLKFYNMFVKPYPECQTIFGGLVREAEVKVKPRHPTGLWKLFKPHNFSDTLEDMKNMKLFMDYQA